MDELTLQTSPIMTLTTDLGAIDVMDRVSGVGDFKKVLARSLSTEFDGVTLRVLDLNALIAAKRATGRPKDKDQLPELEALREMKRLR
jgi:predicted nucleotidyltransferase